MSEPLSPSEPQGTRATLAESALRRQPAKSVVSAFVVGLILSVFPVGRIVGFVVGVALTLLRPILLALGGLKLWEEVEKRQKKQ
jgi:hypothetical protein